MPKGSEELTNSRKREIVSACASLYKTMSFKDITIRDIGEKTSFTRTSIYNYFQTKEEIFLALLQREYELWISDLKSILKAQKALTADDFADKLAHTLESRKYMLKLMSMNLYDIEGNSRIENLVEFKTAYYGAMCAVSSCLEKNFPQMTVNDVKEFQYAFFPFLFGIYPYTTATDKQKQAMKLVNINFPQYSIYEITKSFVAKLIKNL